MKKGLSLVMITLFFLQAGAQQTLAVTKNESSGLAYMREEEKLARDVYDSMYAKWNVNPFGNIRQSERVHMDRMKTLLNNYGVDDPVMGNSDQPGVFRSEFLQKAYHELVGSGTNSLTESLKAGAKIEELDIADLDKRMAQTTKEDILAAYKFLRMGSENHLRAFVRRLKSQGVDYQPGILKKELFYGIINGENQEAGCGNEPGKGQGNGQGAGKGRGNGPGKGKCCNQEAGKKCQ